MITWLLLIHLDSEVLRYQSIRGRSELGNSTQKGVQFDSTHWEKSSIQFNSNLRSLRIFPTQFNLIQRHFRIILHSIHFNSPIQKTFYQLNSRQFINSKILPPIRFISTQKLSWVGRFLNWVAQLWYRVTNSMRKHNDPYSEYWNYRFAT